MTERAEPTWTACGNCDRGGRGNAKDKCACGWQVAVVNNLGCYLGTPIIGDPRKPPKLSRATRRYLQYLDVSDYYESFGDFLRHNVARGGDYRGAADRAGTGGVE